MTKSLDSLFSLEGRAAVVTGGATGVGAMLARGLLMGGARVLISGRNQDTCKKSVENLREFGSCDFVCGDLSSLDGVTALAKSVADLEPGLSILVNNAGMTVRSEFEACSSKEFDDVLALNVKAPFLMAQALHPILKKNASSDRPSHIVNIGSIAGMVSAATSYSYPPSKAALHHLTKVLARKLAPDHIHVNAIAPGFFPSKMTEAIIQDELWLNATRQQIPVGREGAPDDLANVIIAVVSNNYMTGNIIPIDGGMAA